MEPSPKGEGSGRRAGSFGLLGALLIPKDPRGIVLACGSVALAAVGINAVVSGDWIGFGYVLVAAIAYFFVQTRLVPAVLWVLVALGGLLGATAGNPSNWVVVGLGGLLAVVSIFRPELDRQPTSRNLEAGAALPELESVHTALSGYEPLRNLEVQSVPAASNGHVEVDRGGTESVGGQTVISGARGRIKLRTIGSLRIEVDGRDETQRLRDQPRLEFLFSYLLARSVCVRELAMERTAIAEEMAPGVTQASQRDRLRKTLHAFQAALGPDLKGLVHVTATQIRFDLTGVDVDFVGLAEMANRVSRRHGLIDAPLAEDVRGLLETKTGELLPSFSDLEHQVTGGAGNAHQVIEEARLHIAGWRADLTAALARHLDAVGRPQSSIAFLQSALAQSQDREDLARLLVAAYMQTGQTASAEDIRLQYGLSSGEVG